MQRDVKVLYAITILHALILLTTLFVPSKLVCNLLLIIFSISAVLIACVFIKKRGISHLKHKEATLVCFVFSLVVLMLLYLLGLKFGFSRGMTWKRSIYTYIFPYIVVIVASEFLRWILLSQKKSFVTIISFFSFVILDVALFSEKDIFKSLSTFMSAVGLVFLPALTSNLLYYKLSKTHGAFCVIPYRLVMALYPYIITFKPAVPNALMSFLMIVFPLVLLWFVSALYKKRTMIVSRKNTIVQTIFTITFLSVMLLMICFISGIFKHKAIVVASESMAGELYKGDVVIYESYNNQFIEKGQIILFNRNGTTIIHRVVDIKKINGVYRYYTKGDANDGMDSGYITNESIVGIVRMKMKYIGYPTVWMHELFKK